MTTIEEKKPSIIILTREGCYEFEIDRLHEMAYLFSNIRERFTRFQETKWEKMTNE